MFRKDPRKFASFKSRYLHVLVFTHRTALFYLIVAIIPSNPLGFHKTCSVYLLLSLVVSLFPQLTPSTI